MIYNYNECIKKYKTNYNLLKAIQKNELYKIDNGVYSDQKNPKELEIFIKKHPNVIFTMESAFFYLGISDIIPDKYDIVTNKDATKYKDNNIHQYFMNGEITDIGKTTIIYNDIKVPVYNEERMLIELIRYKNKIPFDYYKEIINFYRDHIDEINIALVLDYLKVFPKRDFIERTIQMEVL